MTTPVSLGTNQSATTVSSLAITTTAAIASGDTVWVALVTGATAPSAVSVADDGSNSYSADVALNSNNVAWFRSQATNAVSSGGSITVTLTGGTSAVCAVAVKQAGQTLTTDGSLIDSGLFSNTGTPSKTISETGGDLVLAVCAMFGSETSAPTVDTPYTLIDYSENSNRGLLVAYNQPGTSGNETFTPRWPSAHSGEILAFNYTTGTGGGGTTTNITASDTATYDDTPTDILIDDTSADVTYSETSALTAKYTSTDTAAYAATSAVSVGPATSDSHAWDDVSQLTILDGSNVTTSDLYSWADVSSLDSSLAVLASDSIRFTDNQLLVEAGIPGAGAGTVTIVSPVATVVITPRSP